MRIFFTMVKEFFQEVCWNLTGHHNHQLRILKDDVCMWWNISLKNYFEKQKHSYRLENIMKFLALYNCWYYFIGKFMWHNKCSKEWTIFFQNWNLFAFGLKTFRNFLKIKNFFQTLQKKGHVFSLENIFEKFTQEIINLIYSFINRIAYFLLLLATKFRKYSYKLYRNN